jgi:antitoxin ParD1/3/4
MRTNIDIDDALLAEAMRAGPYTTKKETVEAGLRLLARQAAYREILKWEGKLQWEGDESIDWTQPATDEAPAPAVHESGAAYSAAGQAPSAATRPKAARRAGR